MANIKEKVIRIYNEEISSETEIMSDLNEFEQEFVDFDKQFRELCVKFGSCVNEPKKNCIDEILSEIEVLLKSIDDIERGEIKIEQVLEIFRKKLKLERKAFKRIKKEI